MNIYFRPVHTKQVIIKKRRPQHLIDEILARPDNKHTREFLEEPYDSYGGIISSRKSCSECGDKLEPDEFVWSVGIYQCAKWRTVDRFCKHCIGTSKVQGLTAEYPDAPFQGYQGVSLPKWISIYEPST